MTPRHEAGRPARVRRRPRSPRRHNLPCGGCGRDPWAYDDHPGCEPKDVRGLPGIPHAWPEPLTAEDFVIFTDDNPCRCGAMVGSHHHWECSLELCPWADTHPEAGEQLLCCGCYEADLDPVA